MRKETTRSSCDEFTCVGWSKERLRDALRLALYDSVAVAWTIEDGSVLLAEHHHLDDFHPLPRCTADALAEMLWPFLQDADSLNKHGPDGGERRGWRVRVVGSGSRALVAVDPWTIYYAK